MEREGAADAAAARHTLNMWMLHVNEILHLAHVAAAYEPLLELGLGGLTGGWVLCHGRWWNSTAQIS